MLLIVEAMLRVHGLRAKYLANFTFWLLPGVYFQSRRTFDPKCGSLFSSMGGRHPFSLLSATGVHGIRSTPHTLVISTLRPILPLYSVATKMLEQREGVYNNRVSGCPTFCVTQFEGNQSADGEGEKHRQTHSLMLRPTPLA